MECSIISTLSPKTFMERIPNEVLFIILSHLDGRSMISSAIVCRLWNDIVSEISAKTNAWFRICLTEIGVDSIVTLTGLTQLLTSDGCQKAKDSKPWKYWFNLYAVYQRCENCHNRTWSDHTKYIGLEKTTVATTIPLGYLNECRVWTGHYNGRVTVMDVSSNRIQEDFLFLRTPCVGVAALNMGDYPEHGTGVSKPEILVVAASQYGVFIHDDSGKQLWQVSDFPSLGRIFSLCSFGPYFVIGHMSCQTRCYIYKAVKNPRQTNSPCQSHTISCFALMKLEGMNTSLFMFVSLTHNQMVATDMKHLYCWSFDSLIRFDDVHLQGHDCYSPALTMEEPTSTSPLTSPTKQLLLYNNQTLLLSGDSNLHVFKDDLLQKKYRIFTLYLFPQKARCEGIDLIAVWSSLLAIASRNGHIRLYRMAPTSDWPLSLPNNVIHCFESRIDLRTLTLSADRHGPMLVGMGTKGMAFQAWQPPDCRKTHGGTHK